MFSRACEYAIKASIHLANQTEENGHSSVKEISKAIASPEAFTAKILQQLTKSKILSSQKGPSGGFYISTFSTRKIRLMEIVEAIDGDDFFHNCALGLDQCDENKPCPLHEDFKSIKKELKLLLINTTLYDLASGLAAGKTFLSF